MIAAGNVLALLAPGPKPRWSAGWLLRSRPGGLLVAGFGLDAAHLPVPPSLTLQEYDAHCAAAGLTPVDRFAAWDAAAYDDGGYAVSVHRLGS
ncbi:hypothetical protein [Streptomyces sp. KL116D]|uniref:hypothetical protein n=1 Tax=Streptomyces sp. KL116D TaxID=3045152 RepID=UPI00355921CC